MSQNRRGIEVAIFVWVDPAQGCQPPLYSVSGGKHGVCIDLPIEAAMERIREELKAATLHPVTA
jgi:hypothetical protein